MNHLVPNGPNRITIDEAGLLSEKLFSFGTVECHGFVISLDTTKGTDWFFLYSKTNLSKRIMETTDLIEVFNYIRDLKDWCDEQ